MLRVGLLIALVSSLLLAPSAGAVIQRVGEFGPTTEYRYRGGIRVLFLDGRVTLAGTTGLGDRTNRGVGVGSSEQKVKNRVPGVACETFESTRICSRGAEQPGERG